MLMRSTIYIHNVKVTNHGPKSKGKEGREYDLFGSNTQDDVINNAAVRTR
jgi:hypothetical protein